MDPDQSFLKYAIGQQSRYCLDRLTGFKLVIGVALALFYYNIFDLTAGHQAYVPALATAATWGLLFYGTTLWRMISSYLKNRKARKAGFAPVNELTPGGEGETPLLAQV